MSLEQDIDQIQNHHDLAKYVKQLLTDYEAHPDQWENVSLASYLEAMSSWLDDAGGYYKNHSLPMPDAEVWKTIAVVLSAAAVYE